MFYPWSSEGCIGAINRTHIQALIPEAEEPGYCNHNGNNTQNVLASFDFEGKFTFFLLPDLKGEHMIFMFSNHTLGGLLRGTTRYVRYYWIWIQENFKKIRPFLKSKQTGRYNLADSGFPNEKMFLAPYQGPRYHLHDYGEGNIIHVTTKRFSTYSIKIYVTSLKVPLDFWNFGFQPFSLCNTIHQINKPYS